MLGGCSKVSFVMTEEHWWPYPGVAGGCSHHIQGFWQRTGGQAWLSPMEISLGGAWLCPLLAIPPAWSLLDCPEERGGDAARDSNRRWKRKR